MRRYSYHLWCVKKHLLLAKTHLEETVEKLYRECGGDKCNISSPTRFEAEDAVRNIIAAEEHIVEILTQKPIEELRKVSDKLRGIRQDVAQTNLPFRAELEVIPASVEKIEHAAKQTDDIITKVDKHAVEMEQELSDVECPRCKEDFMKLLEKLSEGKINE